MPVASVQPPRWSPVALLATCLLFSAVGEVAAGSPPAEPHPAGPLPVFKIYLEEPGVYRVGFDDLAAAGLDGPGLPSSGLGLTQAGEPVPVWVEDGGDGVFGAGDWIELVGEHLAGEVSYSSEDARYNVYFLAFDHSSPARMRPGVPAAAGAPAGDDSPAFRRTRHLEQDLIILRLRPRPGGGPEELWYWVKLSQIQKKPWSQTLDLRDLDLEAAGTVDLRIELRGWSTPRAKPTPETADHRIEVELNGVPIASAEWNGTEKHLVEISGPAAGYLQAGDNVLALRVPKRLADAEGQELVDVVNLNWIEISYPRSARIGEAPARLELEGPAGGPLRLVGEPRELTVYGDLGSRTAIRDTGRRADSGAVERVFHPIPGEASFLVAGPQQLRPPEAVVRDRPSRLAATDRRADYLMIAHPRLRAAIQPLADFHRSRGLTVEVVDVQDVYDEFSHGIAYPSALRDFLAHAYHRWQAPAPRFVLLVGDASWDVKNSEVQERGYPSWTYRPRDARHFARVPGTPYSPDAKLNDRGLIPTWNYGSYQGHSASDNYFVAVDGDDGSPDMAIGRLPVVEPEEVARIVEKTVRYASNPEVGPWRRRALFITNESRGFQNQSDRLARDLSSAGFTPHKVYPASSEVSNEHHTRKLIETFDEGQLFVHFLGHGGRYIWRTGPPDLKKNHDLFSLDHLDQLASTERLPVVLSLTCYSAPFDHPNADSIGEKLLRIPGRGAVAVFAASWRNSPSSRWGQVLLEELTAPGATVGEAVMRSKHQIKNRDFVETYNLLGDPAVPVALPAGAIELEAAAEAAAGDPLSIRGMVALAGFTGKVLVDLVDAGGEALRTESLDLEAPEFAVDFELSAEELAGLKAVRAYAWNADRGVDAAGALVLAKDEAEAPRRPARRRGGPTP